MSDVTLLYCTAPDRATAAAIARTLVEEHLVACANILDGVLSLYRWEGRLAEEPEAVMIVKTQSVRAGEVTERIRALHPYQCPCVVALPVTGGNPDFLSWIADETAMGREGG
ncbi:MAG: divalent-cation tolerance protein CutA [Telmatospirillum sp.]|nr:divalent-cation tolerance protein CutA [Telmatospirillum sp.]